MDNTNNNKRFLRRSASAMLWGYAMLIQGGNAFLMNRPTRGQRHQTLSLSSPSFGLSFSSASNKLWATRENVTPNKTGRFPTNEEQLDLLVDAVELRRLKKVESDQIASFSKKYIPKLILCRAAGYGDDLDAYDAALDRGHRAREALITRNMGLVHFVVNDVIGTNKIKKRTLQSLSRDDLIQEGAIGLSRAVDRWDPEIGGKFSTYAVYWIKAAVLRCIAERDDMIYVPSHVSTAVNKLTTAAKQLGIEWDENSLLMMPQTASSSSSLSASSYSWKQANAAKALAEKAGLTEAQVQRAAQVKRRRSRGGIRSFETWMQQGKDLAADHGASANAMSLSSSSSSSSLDLDHLQNELAKFLRPKEVEALSWRYGLTTTTTATTTTTTSKKTSKKNNKSKGPITQGKWGEAMSFVEVGKQMHVSAEYGRRLCNKALEKLRSAHEQGRLEPSLLV